MREYEKKLKTPTKNLIDKDLTNFVYKELFSIIQEIEKIKKELKNLKKLFNHLSMKIESITGVK